MFKVYGNVRSVVNNNLVSMLSIEVVAVASSVQDNGYLVTLPPQHNSLPLAPHTTKASMAGQMFGWRRTPQAQHSGKIFVDLVLINGRQHQVSLNDGNGNSQLWLIFHTLIDLMILLGWTHVIWTHKKSVSIIWSTVGATRTSYNEHFHHPTLSEDKMI